MSPDTYEHTTPEADARARYGPSRGQLTFAAGELAEFEETETKARAFVALALPGKTFGLWSVGQRVEFVPGCWIGRSPANGGMLYTSARDEALAAARAQLVGRPGTVAWVAIGSTGSPLVNEEFGHESGGVERGMAGITDTDQKPILREDYAASLREGLERREPSDSIQVYGPEARAIADLLDELAAIYPRESLGRLARELSVRLWDRMGI